MFNCPQYVKLKTNLELAIKRLKNVQCKKYELCQRVRREIASYIKDGKHFKARIKAQAIIRDDFYQEAMELVEMFCTRFVESYELFESMKILDESLVEPVTSLIWVTSYMQNDIPEFKEITKQLTRKFGTAFVRSSLKNEKRTVNRDLIDKVRWVTPPGELVEKYMIEIATSYKVPYEAVETKNNKEAKDANDWRDDFNKRVEIEQASFRSPKGGWVTKEFEVYKGYGKAVDCTDSCRKVFEDLHVKKHYRPSRVLPSPNKKETICLISDVVDCEKCESCFNSFDFDLGADEKNDGDDLLPTAPQSPSSENVSGQTSDCDSSVKPSEKPSSNTHATEQRLVNKKAEIVHALFENISARAEPLTQERESKAGVHDPANVITPVARDDDRPPSYSTVIKSSPESKCHQHSEVIKCDDLRETEVIGKAEEINWPNPAFVQNDQELQKAPSKFNEGGHLEGKIEDSTRKHMTSPDGEYGNQDRLDDGEPPKQSDCDCVQGEESIDIDDLHQRLRRLKEENSVL